MAAPAAPATPKLTVLVAGGSGFVGTHLLQQLTIQPELPRVVAVSRRPLAFDHPRLSNRIVRFETLEQSLDGIRADIAMCCLGTTLRTAGSPEAFRIVDHDHVVAFARAAYKAGVRRFVLNSSVAADPKSKRLYLRVKGEVEAELAKIGFASLDILQPSLLLGLRKEVRPLELLGLVISPLVNLMLLGKAQRYRGISGATVATAMASLIRSQRKGVTRYTYREIVELAKPSRRR